jgi:flagellar biosynthesis/type III secretory pathway chaperone
MSAGRYVTVTADEPMRLSAASVAVEAAFAEVCDSLGALSELLKGLVATAEQKLAAMRAADADGLQVCAAREGELLEQVGVVNRRRQAAIAQLAQALQVPADCEVNVWALARWLREPMGSILRARIRGLFELAERLRHLNAVAARVAQDLQSHIRAVFAEVAKANRESVLYGPEGQQEQGQVRSSVEAVG